MLNPNVEGITLDQSEYKKYARHLILPYIEINGQKRLKSAKILCVGLGGLASACLLYLVTAGVNNIGIIDCDIVEVSNLQRQVIYKANDIGYKKVKCVQKNIQEINPKCKIIAYDNTLNKKNAMQIVPAYDIIIDSTDNLESKEVISNACYTLNKPHIFGAISEFEGQVSVFNYQEGPIYRDLYLQNSVLNIQQTNCTSNGVLGVLPGIIGILQATEVIKIIIGLKNSLSGYVLIYNALNTSFRKIKIKKSFSSTQLSNTYRNLLGKTLNNISIETHSLKAEFNYNNINTEAKIESNRELLLVDIREPREYCLSHIQNSINIPIRKLRHKYILSFLINQSRIKTICIYCNTESRSNAALSLLLKHGIVSYKLNYKQ